MKLPICPICKKSVRQKQLKHVKKGGVEKDTVWHVGCYNK